MAGGAGCLQLVLYSGQHKSDFPETMVSTEAWGRPWWGVRAVDSPVARPCSRLPAGRSPPQPGLWTKGPSCRTQAERVCPSRPLGRSTGQGPSGPSVPPAASKKGCASSAASLAGGVRLPRSSHLGHSPRATSVLFSTLWSLRDSCAGTSASAGLRGVTRYRVIREKPLQ